MNNTFVYRPNQPEGWFVPFAAFIGMIAFVIAGAFLHMGDIKFIFFAAVGIISFWLSKKLYDISNIAVLFESEGLRIVGGRHNEYRYFSWADLPYACYVRSFRRHLFLVLSPKELSIKEAKSFANRGANSSQICIDSVVVIHMNVLQTAAQLKSRITEYVKYVSSFDT